jgi:6-phosphogluconolactonase (cycloisomerase 2 family)
MASSPDDGYFTRAGEKLPGPFAGAVQHENKPSQYEPDGPPPPQFRIVHAVRISHDGLVYVCDRTNDRIQVFRKDGTFDGKCSSRSPHSAADRCGTSPSRRIRIRPF